MQLTSNITNMKTHSIIEDYYGATNFIEINKDKDLTIFIVDDNPVYLKLLKMAVKRDNFTVLTFSTGEECLNYLELKPELVILDYHLDGVNPNALKGDKISELINQKLPETETILISSDEKFHFVSNINISKKMMFKDEKVHLKLQKKTSSLLTKIKTKKRTFNRTKTMASAFITTISLILLYIVLNLFI
jgi:two-component system, OmpR family, response regulator